MTHTTGPWWADSNGEIWSKSAKIGTIGGFNFPQLVERNKDRWFADAKLIAAAPDLLDALAALNEYFSNFSQDSLGHKKLGIARAALAKATGGA